MTKSLHKFGVFALILLVVIAVCVALLLRHFSPIGKIDHILIISIDTCRADYLGCYGHNRQTTPNIDNLARESILFENVISPVPLTLPAHSSMLTGTIPPYHGVHDNFDYQLANFNVTLAEMLKDNGFVTGAIVSTFIMDSQFGLDQGFDTYDDHFETKRKAFDAHVNERKAGQANLLATDWLAEHKDRPFFLFLHYFDPHFTYDPPEPFASRFADDLYAGEIAYTDHCIGQIIEKLRQLKLYNSTLIILTGDHGEMLGEHGERDHSYFVYQSALKVPLIFKLPGRSQHKRIKKVVGLIDIVPTVCSLMEIKPPAHMRGRDLSGYFTNEHQPPQERYLYCESLTATKYNANSLLGVVTDRWKYIQTTRPELYDLTEDPNESNNLVDKHPNRAHLLKEHLALILEEQMRKGSDSRLELDQQARKRLESLGYVSSNVNEDFEFDQSKDDPKDLVNFHNANTDLADLISNRRYAQAKALCEKMLAQRPDFFTGHFQMGRIAMEQGDFPAAVVHFSRALEIKPADGITHNNLGIALKEQGKLDEAARHFRHALQAQPGSAEVHNNLGLLLRAQGQLEQAISHFRQALEAESDSPQAHYNLATSLQLQGKLEEAIAHYRHTVNLQPDFAPAHYNLAVALESRGEPKEAIRHYLLALKFNPDYPRAHYKLGSVLAATGQVDAALKHLREAQRLRPDWPAPANKIKLILSTRSHITAPDPNQPEQ